MTNRLTGKIKLKFNFAGLIPITTKNIMFENENYNLPQDSTTTISLSELINLIKTLIPAFRDT
ncbi:MAG: hypothetical protein LBP59_14910, partial [Planctomycetaceae bacterium]|nr:hypothetical protein [Planctomycetaceae bacterium]